MYMVGLGLVLMVMKYLDVGPVGKWDWWVVLIPFGLAIAWWSWADASGWTKRKAMDRENARKQARLDKQKLAIGTLQPKKRK